MRAWYRSGTAGGVALGPGFELGPGRAGWGLWEVGMGRWIQLGNNGTEPDRPEQPPLIRSRNHSEQMIPPPSRWA